MSIRDCLDKLVKSKQITRDAADRADALWRRYQNKYSLDMSPAQADAAAALAAAREMNATTRQQKHSVASQVLRQTDIEQLQMSHPKGPVVGGLAPLTRDTYRTGSQNVETRARSVFEMGMSEFNTGMEAYKSTMAGLKQDLVGIRNMVGELFGVDTGDAVAKASAQGWIKATDSMVKRAQSAGKIFEEMENWRLMQFWNADRVRKFGMGVEFRRDLQNAVDSGGLKIFDKERQEFATDGARIAALLDKAVRDITTEAGTAPVFSKEMRTFHFEQGEAGFKAFMQLQEKYGTGQDVLSAMVGHLASGSREIGLVEILGPQHRATVAMLTRNALAEEKTGQNSLRPARLLGMESASAIERTYKVLNGEANGVEATVWAAILGGARSLMTASSLGSAVVPAIFGDTVTTLLAARYNGMPGFAVLGRAFEVIFRENPKMQEDAARLLFTGHAVSDHAISTVRYADQRASPELLRKTADFVIRSSGLAAWTEGLKKAFGLEFMGYLARWRDTPLDKLDPPLKMFLDRYKISAAEWDHLRGLPTVNVHGAQLFDSSLAKSDPAALKLYEGVIQERALAVLEPDARVRGVTTQGARSGTFAGEISRSLTQFQSFPMTMVTTHLHALAVKDGAAGGYWSNWILFGLSHVAAGAAIVQARQMLQGRDPITMDQPKFWAQAGMQGGGLGFFGDLVVGIAQASDRSITGKVTGPLGGLMDDTGRFASAVAKGKPGAIGQGVGLLKHVTPGSTLWFSRLVTDRLIFDQISRAVDPEYTKSFQRSEQRAIKAYNQRYWWRRGETAPDRLPAFGGGS